MVEIRASLCECAAPLRPRPADKRHPDGVFLTTQREGQYLWLAADQDGKILDIHVQR
jgi:hypothetical protein